MLTLSDGQVAALLITSDVVTTIERAFARDYRRTVRMPTRTQTELPGGVLLTMPCFDSSLPALGIKLVFVREGEGPGDRIQAFYALLDPASGKPLAMLEANRLTDLRTAATSAVATKYLARKNSTVLGIFGTGRQARAHLEVFTESFGFQRALTCGSSPARSEEFARVTQADLKPEAADARTVAAESDVICTCTTSNVPLFEGRWLRPGTHLNLVGAFRPASREVDDETVRRARVVVDTYDGALAEAGDLLIPLQQGAISRDHLLADLHELLSGKTAVRRSDDDITLFKSVGCALEDLVIAHLVYHRASRTAEA
ncbi:MAG: ornithine cyclodeaminase family protein [Acidobacteria bacterium]|nr:ornithine cyclodeaminase family protein [Acidobacteriota bacterium]